MIMFFRESSQASAKHRWNQPTEWRDDDQDGRWQMTMSQLILVEDPGFCQNHLKITSLVMSFFQFYHFLIVKLLTRPKGNEVCGNPQLGETLCVSRFSSRGAALRGNQSHRQAGRGANPRKRWLQLGRHADMLGQTLDRPQVFLGGVGSVELYIYIHSTYISTYIYIIYIYIYCYVSL